MVVPSASPSPTTTASAAFTNSAVKSSTRLSWTRKRLGEVHT